jgi:hypothetical protein
LYDDKERRVMRRRGVRRRRRKRRRRRRRRRRKIRTQNSETLLVCKTDICLSNAQVNKWKISDNK